MAENEIVTKEEIIECIKYEILRDYPFFNLCIPVLDYDQCKVKNICCTASIDKDAIYYNVQFLKEEFINHRATRGYLHMLFHKLFLHFMSMSQAQLDERLWNVACDIAVENTLNELATDFIKSFKIKQQTKIIEELKNCDVLITAENIYHFLMSNQISEYKLKQMEDAFKSDDHSIWYVPCDDGRSSGILRCLSASQDLKTESKMALENAKRHIGKRAGSFIQNIEEVHREKYNYSSFLNKFSISSEAIKENTDEYDYIFYTYGMNLYPEKRMPLIEPLEYKDVKRIKEFVIAIDTSGSVEGELVQKFIQKTYNILMNEESYFQKINIHIIQCDTQIQEDHKITSQEELEQYIKTMKLHGFGGTDFRPVFQYVDQLIKDKEFNNLKGLLYFTDGYGDFPSRQPVYKTAFAFIENGYSYNNQDIPPWAIKLTLKKEDIIDA